MNQQHQIVTDLEEEGYSAEDYFAIAKRRKTPMLLTMGLIAAIAFILALALPAKYTSQSTILIEEQEVPREFVISTITSFAAQQIQVISQRVLTADTIAEIADKFGLFIDPDTKRRPPATQIADIFRQQMLLELVSADVIDPRSGRPQEATIAFTLSFEHERASTAQKVTNDLVTRFLDENLRNRTERVASTEAFLAAQASNLNDELARIEGEIAAIKRIDGAALPEMFQYNVGTLDRTSTEISEIDRRLRELSRLEIELNAELGMTDSASNRASSTGEFVMSLRDQITALNREYEQKSTIYQELHPDIVSVKKQIAALNELLENNTTNQATSGATNPAYILLRTRLDATQGEISSLREKQKELQIKADKFQTLISRSPTVEIDYNAKLREFSNTQSKYQEVRAKQLEAELSEDMEQERKGERFVMVEPPNLPIDPSSPNRPAIIIIGLVLALGAGIGLALLLETFDKALYDDRTLTRLSGMPPFATVGYIETKAEVVAEKKLRRRVLLSVIGTVCAVTLFIHFAIKPIDVVFFVLMERLGL